jgi:hypothetical protein
VTEAVTIVDCGVSFPTPTYSWCVSKINTEVKKDVEVPFAATAVGCAPFEYVWDFGNGPTPPTNDPNPSHMYMQASHGGATPRDR